MSATALLVGGMQSRLDILQRTLEQLGWQVTPSLNPREAVERLKEAPCGAVFCDEQLRGASPTGLLVWVRRNLPEVPFYLFSNDHDPGRFRMSGPPSALLHFPPIAAQLPLPDDTPPPERPPRDADTPLSGDTGLLPLANLIEMLALAQRSAVIELGGGQTGLVVLRRGRLEHALCLEPPCSGLPALAALLRREIAFRVVPYRSPARATLNMSAASAVTEAARLADEEARAARLVEAVARGCPAATAVAVGQPLRGAPWQGVGDLSRLGAMTQALLEASRGALRGALRDGLWVSEAEALVLSGFAEDWVLAALAPAPAKAVLYRAVQAAVAAA